MKITERECPINLVLSFHVEVSHTFNVSSFEPEIRYFPSTEKQQHVT